MEKVLEVRNLKKKYGRFEALKGIDIDLYRGEIFGFLGPNGAGKTTTVEILEGLRKAGEGEITFFGHKIHGQTPSFVKERIGVVLQETRFLDHLKVKEVIELFASFFKNAKSPEEIIKMVQIEEKAEDFTDNLSGGQRQRLAIATALVNDPDIIFLDEPTVGLDPQSRESVWKLVRDLKKNDKTIFLTTHYMEEAQALCDRISIIDRGKIVASDTPKNLIKKYGGKSEIDFTCSELPSKSVIEELKSVDIVDDHFRIETDDITKTLEWLVEWSKRNSLKITDISLVEPTLEDVFLTLTGRGLRD
ncbi:MAG: ABC transporter ATP-binding protein [Mesoaciditoga sp.]|uniref:ABC transporter ATP-binding protein n=1 Tax=Athalassotoga sp. TaxID=2022597 RepID=UPI000CC0BB76|nr:MAG: ABC transporter ATP-binding protein [Mesoaciditoga sp.]HEU23829.1 ABC transporter ATP-binding protein [Mesoaciditoga lauensis]